MRMEPRRGAVQLLLGMHIFRMPLPHWNAECVESGVATVNRLFRERNRALVGYLTARLRFRARGKRSCSGTVPRHLIDHGAKVAQLSPPPGNVAVGSDEDMHGLIALHVKSALRENCHRHLARV